MATRKHFFLLLHFIMLICKISATKLTPKEFQALTKYKCTFDEKKKNANSCKVEMKNVMKRAKGPKLPKPRNCKLTLITDAECNIHGVVKFGYTGTPDQKVEGFKIYFYAGSGTSSTYEVTLPQNYNQSEGGRFDINMKTFNIYNSLPATERYDIKVSALPKSTQCGQDDIYFAGTCLDYDEHKRKGCSEDIEICANTTTTSPTTASETTPLSLVPEETSSNTMLFVGILLSTTVIVIIVVALTVCKRRQQKKATKKRAVILAPSGDVSSKFADMANLIASELKSSDEYEEVFFTGWMQVNNLGNNLEKLVDALHRSTVVILFVSPFGKTSYENFLEQGQLATWKDEFVIGAHSLFRTSNHTLINSKITSSKKRKILVVYHYEEPLQKSDVLHKDFELHAHRCYDLNTMQDNSALYKQLLRHQRRVVYHGETCIEDGGTTKFI